MVVGGRRHTGTYFGNIVGLPNVGGQGDLDQVSIPQHVWIELSIIDALSLP